MSALKQNLFKAVDFIIRVESGPDKGKAFLIKPPRISIGRDPRCQVTLTDPKVSRQQCTIRFTDNVICEDVSSRRTTKVNGQPCKNTVLKPGDVITFGQTKIVFSSRTNEKAKPQLGPAPKVDPVVAKEKAQNKKSIKIFLGVIMVLAVAFKFLQQEPVAQEELKLATSEDLKEQIEESKERTSLIRESYQEKKKLSQKKHLYQVERHFIQGFRDLLNGQHGRAIDSFGTTIASDQNHGRAQQYLKTAKKKQADLIDTHLRDGQKYRDKLMYDRCAAEFEKALILINDENSEKYKLAKTHYEECRLLKTGGY